MSDRTDDESDEPTDEVGSPASPNLVLGRLPGLCLDEVLELNAHRSGFDLGRASSHYEGWPQQFLTGYVKGYRRALFQVATARFGRSPQYEDALWALTDLREIVRLLDRVPTATGWREVLQPLYDRKRAELFRRATTARDRLLAVGTERLGPPSAGVRQTIDRTYDYGEHWILDEWADRVPHVRRWRDLVK